MKKAVGAQEEASKLGSTNTASLGGMDDTTFIYTRY